MLLRIATFASLLLALAICNCSRAESIWQRRTREHSYLFVDSKARCVGDLLTVLIAQSTDVDSREDRSMEKSTDTKGFFSFDSESGGGFGAQAADASLDARLTSGRRFGGESNYTTEEAFTDRVTVTVRDVLPNGNLVVSGDRQVRVAGEDRTLVISGVVRDLDIGPDNTIASRYIAEFRMEYQTGGPSRHFTRQGWLGRITNPVWPF